MLKALRRLLSKSRETPVRIEPTWDMSRSLPPFREAKVQPLRHDGWRLKLDNYPSNLNQGGIRHL